MSRLTSAAGCMCVVLALAATAVAEERFHPRLKEQAEHIHSITVLQPWASHLKVAVRGVETSLDLADAIARDLSVGAVEALRQRGLDVRLAPADKAGDLAPLQMSIDALLPLIDRKKKDIQKGRFTLVGAGGDVNTDLLLAIRASAREQSKGKGFLSGGLLGMLVSGTRVTGALLLIDPATSDVVGGLFFRDKSPDSVEKEVRKLVAKVPFGSSTGGK